MRTSVLPNAPIIIKSSVPWWSKGIRSWWLNLMLTNFRFLINLLIVSSYSIMAISTLYICAHSFFGKCSSPSLGDWLFPSLQSFTIFGCMNRLFMEVTVPIHVLKVFSVSASIIFFTRNFGSIRFICLLSVWLISVMLRDSSSLCESLISTEPRVVINKCHMKLFGPLFLFFTSCATTSIYGLGNSVYM